MAENEKTFKRHEYPLPTLVHFCREHLEALENWRDGADDDEMREEFQSRIDSLTAALESIDKETSET